VPRWAEIGGQSQLLQRINDAESRPRLIAEMEQNLKRRGGAESLLIVDSRDRQYVGKRLNQIRPRDEQDAGRSRARNHQERGRRGVASFNMNEKDIRRFMKESSS
jgi:hypothetical protein